MLQPIYQKKNTTGLHSVLVIMSSQAADSFERLYDFLRVSIVLTKDQRSAETSGAFVWDQSGIRIIGKTRVSVCLGAILIPEYLDFHSGA